MNDDRINPPSTLMENRMPGVRTRFAPSPTGYMHIGGMRTALFNWLWARHNGGQFILRIDDTDVQRNIDAALAPILRAFAWLKLNWDEGPEVGGPFGPYYQSQRSHLYRQAAEKLVAQGKAFYDFDPPEVTQADRAQAEREKKPFLNMRRSLELSPEQVRDYQEQGKPAVLRFLIPRDQKVAIDDAVRQRVEWDCALLPDPVIMRPDGSFLYNFATVVDDAHMQITHVIRAEEHLSNTPLQVLMHQALGNPLPAFAHIPFVAAPGTKEKLSKRENKLEKYRKNPQFKKMFDVADRVFPRIGLGDSATLNPVMVEYYEKLGYLPDAVFNALARLGWSLDDKTEIMSRETIISSFTLDRVIKSSAGLDPDKLLSFQTYWMSQCALEEKIDGCLPYLIAAELVADASPQVRQYVARVIEALGERLKIFADILDYDEFFIEDDKLVYDADVMQKRLGTPEAKERLLRFRARLTTAAPFAAAALEALMGQFVADEGIKLADIIHALRVAVTGKSTGVGMFECLALLGRERTLSRIDRALAAG